jgi:1-acyl-sn-glycerol-3-phosphate acyltransferase
MSDQPTFVRGKLSPRGIEALRRVFEMIFKLIARIEVRGMENIPAEGGFILTTNHLSSFDPPLVFVLFPFPRRGVALAADVYRRHPLFRWVLESVGVIWVNRGAASPTTLKAAIQAIQEGYIMGIAPEGTRSRTGALQEAKAGVAFLAMASGAPIIPLAITNTEKLGAAILRLRRITLTLTFGKPLRFTAPERGKRDEKLAECTSEIMCQIAALLPPEYRGAYANHPRLKELLNGDC